MYVEARGGQKSFDVHNLSFTDTVITRTFIVQYLFTTCLHINNKTTAALNGANKK